MPTTIAVLSQNAGTGKTTTVRTLTEVASPTARHPELAFGAAPPWDGSATGHNGSRLT
ncbi:hypothetical protein [Conexibacter sp. S30A1]|uniref:hypothetical protein n=1 Tax=Conexibacter sp. S30A1 TaxID=2937800 RepID=UPI00200CD17D|nr:hypothetical protein [Conexibacter sp. S30A1]